MFAPICLLRSQKIHARFSVVNPPSLDNVRQNWAREVNKYYQAPIMLVGTQVDLRDKKDLIDKLAKVS